MLNTMSGRSRCIVIVEPEFDCLLPLPLAVFEIYACIKVECLWPRVSTQITYSICGEC